MAEAAGHGDEVDTGPQAGRGVGVRHGAGCNGGQPGFPGRCPEGEGKGLRMVARPSSRVKTRDAWPAGPTLSVPPLGAQGALATDRSTSGKWKPGQLSSAPARRETKGVEAVGARRLSYAPTRPAAASPPCWVPPNSLTGLPRISASPPVARRQHPERRGVHPIFSPS